MPSRNVLHQAFPFFAQARILQEEKNSLTVLAPRSGDLGKEVKIQFFGGMGFGRVGAPQLTEDGVVEVASLDDLMRTKLRVIMQRIVAKDYQDVAALVRAGVDLPRGLAAAREMYGPAFQPSESLKALTYFQGGDLEELAHADRETLIGAAVLVRELPSIQLASRDLSDGERHRDLGRKSRTES